jgi:hypothetical protein
MDKKMIREVLKCIENTENELPKNYPWRILSESIALSTQCQYLKKEKCVETATATACCRAAQTPFRRGAS